HRDLHSFPTRRSSDLSKLGLAIDAAFLAQEAYPVFNNIIRTQKNIVDRVQEYPQYIPLVLECEMAVAQKSYSLIQYMTGLTMSIDRKSTRLNSSHVKI